MKTNRFYKMITAIAFMLLLNQFSVVAQYWQLGGNSDAFPPLSGLLTNSNFFGGSGPTSNVVLGTNANQYMFIGGPVSGTSNGLIGIGNGFSTPNYQLDILAGATVGDGVNIASASNSVAYNIGGLPFLWYNNNFKNVFCGVQAGNSISPVGTANSNVYCGYQSGFSDVIGEFNTFMGSQSGFSDIGNSGSGSAAGDYNTFVGNRAGYDNSSGQQNCYYGVLGGFMNVTGSANCEFGDHSGQKFGADLDSNSFYGFETGFNMTTGNSNVLVGDNSGWITGLATPGNFNTFVGAFGGSQQLNPGGNYNITLGYGADAYTGSSGAPGAITNAAVIGAEAVVLNNNQFILGNNSQLCGIGMSTDPVGPMANLEIQTDLDQNVPSGPYPTATGFLGNGSYSTYNAYLGQGFSGLKFRDLTSNSTPNGNTGIGLIQTPPAGFLTVDQYGNVIFDSLSSIYGGCGNPTMLTQNGAIDLNNLANLYFLGNGSGTAVNNVAIGLSNTCPIPPAKLTVLQASGSNNTIGMLVASKDFSSGTFSAAIPAIGIKSFMPPPPSCLNYYNVAGWFEADYTLPGCAMIPQYAVFIPQDGGTLAIGFPFNTHYNNPNFLIDCSSRGRFATYTTPSDSNLKTNIKSFKSGLNVIRGLNMVSYKYNGLAGFDTTGTFYGVIAQNVQAVAPYAVINSLEKLDSTSSPTPILNIDQMAVMYTAINAIKQLDSSTTAHQNTDSVKLLQQQRTIDSLVNALASIQNCLNTLCGGSGDAPVHHSTGNGNSGDSNATITNTQDVMLSAATNAPLLYQNIPNPFSTGTKINYYLPQGMVGATIVFYDTYGNQIKTVPLSQTGNGTLNITPDNLSAGIYSYSLIVNNSVIDTKRMILQK